MLTKQFYLKLLEQSKLQSHGFNLKCNHIDVVHDIISEGVDLSESNYKKVIRAEYLTKIRSTYLRDDNNRSFIQDRQCVDCNKIFPDDFFRLIYDKIKDSSFRLRFCRKCESKRNSKRNIPYYHSIQKHSQEYLDKARRRKKLWDINNKERKKLYSKQYYRTKKTKNAIIYS